MGTSDMDRAVEAACQAFGFMREHDDGDMRRALVAALPFLLAEKDAEIERLRDERDEVKRALGMLTAAVVADEGYVEQVEAERDAARRDEAAIREDLCACEKCDHRQPNPNWCEKCGHRTTWPKWAVEFAESERRREREKIAQEFAACEADEIRQGASSEEDPR